MLKEKLSNLIDVKSIVTISLIIILCIMTVTGREVSDLFSNSVMLVLGFFFGKNLSSNSDTYNSTTYMTAQEEVINAKPDDNN